MLWEIDIHPRGHDGERARVAEEYDLLTHTRDGGRLITGSSRGYLLEGDLKRDQAERLLRELLVDELAETGRLGALGEGSAGDLLATVLLKPGVMDPVALSVRRRRPRPGHPRRVGAHLSPLFRAACCLPKPATFSSARCWPTRPSSRSSTARCTRSPVARAPLTRFAWCIVPLRDLDDAGLVKLSRDGQLALNLAEMKAIQAHFRDLGRDPTDVELETSPRPGRSTARTRRSRARSTSTAGAIDNLLKETIFGATQEIRQRLGRGRLVRQRLRGQRRRRPVRRRLSRLLQGGDAQPSLGHRALRRRQHRPRRRDPRSARHRPGRQADLQHRRLLLRPARHAAGDAAARRAAPAQGDEGRRRRRARLRQSHGHSHGQRRRLLRRALSGQSARLLRHRRADPGRSLPQGGRSRAT